VLLLPIRSNAQVRLNALSVLACLIGYFLLLSPFLAIRKNEHVMIKGRPCKVRYQLCLLIACYHVTHSLSGGGNVDFEDWEAWSRQGSSRRSGHLHQQEARGVST
jgi:hypothetical protein